MRTLFLALFLLTAPALAQNSFVEHCLSRIHIEENRPAETCSRLNEHLFLDKQSKLQTISAQQLGAPTYPSDNSTRMLVVQNPQQIASYGYCYFQFKEWFDPKTFSPDDFAMRVSGIAIVRKELNGFDKWLKSLQGRRCLQKIQRSTNLNATPLTKLLENKEALGYLESRRRRQRDLYVRPCHERTLAHPQP
jgi:hypothetical protein